MKTFAQALVLVAASLVGVGQAQRMLSNTEFQYLLISKLPMNTMLCGPGPKVIGGWDIVRERFMNLTNTEASGPFDATTGKFIELLNVSFIRDFETRLKCKKKQNY